MPRRSPSDDFCQLSQPVSANRYWHSRRAGATRQRWWKNLANALRSANRSQRMHPITLGVAMLRTIFALEISFVAHAALLAEGALAEAQDKSELLRSLHFQKGSVTIGESLASIVLTDKFVFLDSEDSKTFLTKVWENLPAVTSRTLDLLVQ